MLEQPARDAEVSLARRPGNDARSRKESVASKLTPFEELVSRTGLSWYAFVGCVALVFVFSLVIFTYLDGLLGEFFSAGHWRLLSPSALIVYMLAIFPHMRQAGDDTLASFRTLTSMDDDRFNQLLDKMAATPRAQWIAFGIGAVLGFLFVMPEIVEESFSWRVLYWVPANSLMTGLLGWSIYATLVHTRSMAALHYQPLNIEIFDLRPFGPVGHQSLVNALAFFGGGLISLFFVTREIDFSDARTLFLYGLLVLVSALAFFLPMRQTHRVLAVAREEELVRIRHNIAAAYRSLEGLPADSKDLGILPTKLNLWKEYEARVQATKTWPYDFGMLRTFFLSVLTPVGITFAQRLISQLFNL